MNNGGNREIYKGLYGKMRFVVRGVVLQKKNIFGQVSASSMFNLLSYSDLERQIVISSYGSDD